MLIDVKAGEIAYLGGRMKYRIEGIKPCIRIGKYEFTNWRDACQHVKKVIDRRRRLQ